MSKRMTQCLFMAFAALLFVCLAGRSPMAVGGPAASVGAVAEVLRARTIELVDDKGQARAQLKVESDGEVVFRLRDSRGTIRVKLSASEDGSGLVLLNDETEPAVHALARRDGTTITLTEKGKQKRVIEP